MTSDTHTPPRNPVANRDAPADTDSIDEPTLIVRDDGDASSATGESSDNLDDNDRRLFELLDRYVESLHEDDVGSRSVLLERHPELMGLLKCLESLDGLALPPGFDAIPADDDATLLETPGGETRSRDGGSSGFKAGTVFGKYELLAEVGRGGMGVVYEARQTDLDRTVALKMILSNRLASDVEVERFYAEARAAGGIRHANIVGIHEVGELNGQHYFAMDLVRGECLADVIRHGPIDPETAVECLTAVARAVCHLHQHGIVHRDLKPSNILIDDDGVPYVTDFGLAKVFADDSHRTQTGTIMGTPSYMAPEQAAGSSTEVTHRSDVYSLGAILYELLTGRPPFKRDNPLDTLVEVLEGEPTLPTHVNRQIPRELEHICMKCLEKDPERRYESATALADDLDRFLRREPIEARPTGFTQRIRRWARREPALVSRLCGLLFAFLIVQTRYTFVGDDFRYHMKVIALLGSWALFSYVFQQMLKRESLAQTTRFLWAAADAVMLTWLLAIVDPPLGPLCIGYPLLVAASGLFFQVRLVWFMTVCTILAFGGLMFLRPDQVEPVHYQIIFAATLAVVGFIVAYQVHRVRALNRYYQHRRLP